MQRNLITKSAIFVLMLGLGAIPKTWGASNDDSLKKFAQEFGPAIRTVKGVVGTGLGVNCAIKAPHNHSRPHQMQLLVYLDGSRSQEQVRKALIGRVPGIKNISFRMEDMRNLRANSKASKIQAAPAALGAKSKGRLSALKNAQGGNDPSMAGRYQSKTFEGAAGKGDKRLSAGIPAYGPPSGRRSPRGFVASAVPGAYAGRRGLYKNGAPVGAARPQDGDPLAGWRQDTKRLHSEMKTEAHVASTVFYTGILAIIGSLVASMLTMNPMIFAAGLAGGLGLIGSGVIAVPRLAKWWHARQEAKRAAKGLPSLVDVRHQKLNRKPLF